MSGTVGTFDAAMLGLTLYRLRSLAGCSTSVWPASGRTRDAGFEEGQHKRDDSGRFTSGSNAARAAAHTEQAKFHSAKAAVTAGAEQIAHKLAATVHNSAAHAHHAAARTGHPVEVHAADRASAHAVEKTLDAHAKAGAPSREQVVKNRAAASAPKAPPARVSSEGHTAEHHYQEGQRLAGQADKEKNPTIKGKLAVQAVRHLSIHANMTGKPHAAPSREEVVRNRAAQPRRR